MRHVLLCLGFFSNLSCDYSFIGKYSFKDVFIAQTSLLRLSRSPPPSPAPDLSLLSRTRIVTAVHSPLFLLVAPPSLPSPSTEPPPAIYENSQPCLYLVLSLIHSPPPLTLLLPSSLHLIPPRHSVSVLSPLAPIFYQTQACCHFKAKMGALL